MSTIWQNRKNPQNIKHKIFYFILKKIQIKIRNFHTTAAIYNSPLGGKRTIGSIPQNLEIYAKLAVPGRAAVAVDHSAAQLKNQKRFPHSSLKGCPVCPSSFFILKQTGQLSLPTAEPLKGPSPAMLHTCQNPITSNARLPHYMTRHRHILVWLWNSQHPTQLAGLFPCCHCKGLPERGKKQTTTGWLVLDLHIHLAESWPVSYNPPAEGGGNAQWYPVITEPKMEIN